MVPHNTGYALRLEGTQIQYIQVWDETKYRLLNILKMCKDAFLGMLSTTKVEITVTRKIARKSGWIELVESIALAKESLKLHVRIDILG